MSSSLSMLTGLMGAEDWDGMCAAVARGEGQQTGNLDTKLVFVYWQYKLENMIKKREK